jgi:hypothetical protein
MFLENIIISYMVFADLWDVAHTYSGLARLFGFCSI